MKIKALSKEKFDLQVQLMGITPDNVEEYGGKYFISISHAGVETGDTEDEWIPYFKENKRNVLMLYFDDVVEESTNIVVIGRSGCRYQTKPMTAEQAMDTVKFLMNCEPGSEIIIHCAMGQSRSVAVGEFAAKMFGQNPDFIEARIDRNANKHVLKMLEIALNDIAKPEN